VEKDESRMMEERRRAVLRWRDGRELTASIEEGWTGNDPAFAAVLNRGWPLRLRAERPGDDLVASLAREVAKVFSADHVRIAPGGALAGSRGSHGQGS
jgi:hypothetical protein